MGVESILYDILGTDVAKGTREVFLARHESLISTTGTRSHFHLSHLFVLYNYDTPGQRSGGARVFDSVDIRREFSVSLNGLEGLVHQGPSTGVPPAFEKGTYKAK